MSTFAEASGEEMQQALVEPHSKLLTALKIRTDSPMRSQSLMTPAIFIVSALVFPIKRKTDMLSANATTALLRKMGMSKFTYMMATH